MSQTYDYFGNVNPDLLCRIPRSATKILEIGCGSGSLGAAYKSINPRSIYVGIEFDQEAALISQGRLNYVVCGDVEDQSLAIPVVNDEKYDCIIYGDVLEHLRDPWSVLQRHLGLLSDDGVILACIPNVQHWSVVANLLAGNWPLTDQGLFDRTHLRWFTRNTILEWFRSLELSIYDFHPRIFGLEQSKQFISKLTPALKNLELDPKHVLGGMAPLQYVISAGRLPKPSLVIDGFSTIQPEFISEVRLAHPLSALGSCPGIKTSIYRNQMQISPAVDHVQRILIWQRPIFRLQKSDLESIQKLLNQNYLLVIDWDDDPDHWPVIAEDEYVNFKMVHAVQVSKPNLAELIKQWNPSVEIFPNMVDQLPLFDSSSRARNGLRMFFGALNREKDWAPLIQYLNSVFRADPDFWSVSVVHDQKFFDMLDLPDSQKSFVPTCPHSDYLKEMMRCDFAFLPLADSRFNHFKSDLKALEAAACGLAVLASPVVYKAVVRPGETGELFASPSELISCLSAWRENPSHVRQMGLMGRKFVAAERMVAYQVKERETWYRWLAANREQLNRQLLDRVPQLRLSASS